MENHPIPQDITGFEFKLIGDMTLKQFGYIAGGIGIAWVTYILPLPGIIKIPIALVFAGLGAAFAFLPIEGRPLDLMIAKFFKAVFSPTQYLYQKATAQLPSETVISPTAPDNLKAMSHNQFRDFLNALPLRKNRADKEQQVFFQSLNIPRAEPATQPTPAPIETHAYANQQQVMQSTQMVLPSDQNDKEIKASQDEGLQKTALLLEKELLEAKAKEAAQPKIDSKEYLETHQKVLELQGNLNDLLSQKQQLEEKLISLQKTIQNQKTTVFNPSVAADAAPKETKFVRSIPQNMQKSAGMPMAPENPNVITGIIKDPRGNPLPNILVEVKDGQGNAVRAFKTNALGQFASATPLVNGDYTIGFEDPREQNKFDTVAFKANGEIILPIEVISVDTREELRRSLFN